MRDKVKYKNGFTIAETVLSMAFIALIMLMIGATSLQMIRTYRKGISIKTVSSTAQLIIDDFTRAINASAGLKCLEYDSGSFSETPCSGMLSDLDGTVICTGKYTYLFNYGGTDPSRRIEVDGQPIKLYKVNDQGATVCQDPSLVNQAVTAIANDQRKDLLESGDRDLIFHSFAINSVINSYNYDQTFYNISFVLGTFNDQLIRTNDASCKTPSELTADAAAGQDVGSFDYCAINKFNFSARTASGKGRI